MGLQAILADTSSMFTTRVTIVFIDCDGNEVYRTGEGMSKVKEYNTAYREVISEAFISLNGFRHEYKPKETKDAPITISFKDDVKSLPVDDEVKDKAIEEAKEELPVIASKPSEEVTEVQESAVQINDKPQDEVNKVTEVSEEVSKTGDTRLTLYAQQTATGYQLVDTTPSIQFYLRKTSVEGVYLASGNNKNGLVFMKDNQWVFEYYEGDKHVKEVLLIKF
ncbi:MAG: hypothetical protein HKN52_10925 [Eudoraea sp.]|nr:hypothetical protein [Eudoraea sp.]